VCVFGAILVFIKAAFRPVGTAVAGTGSPVSPGTLKRDVFGAVQRAQSAMDTLAVIIAFQRHFTFVCKRAVEPDLFTDSGFVFADGLCDGGLRRAIDDAGKYDPPFLQCQM